MSEARFDHEAGDSTEAETLQGEAVALQPLHPGMRGRLALYQAANSRMAEAVANVKALLGRVLAVAVHSGFRLGQLEKYRAVIRAHRDLR